MLYNTLIDIDTANEYSGRMKWFRWANFCFDGWTKLWRVHWQAFDFGERSSSSNDPDLEGLRKRDPENTGLPCGEHGVSSRGVSARRYLVTRDTFSGKGSFWAQMDRPTTDWVQLRVVRVSRHLVVFVIRGSVEIVLSKFLRSREAFSGTHGSNLLDRCCRRT